VVSISKQLPLLVEEPTSLGEIFVDVEYRVRGASLALDVLEEVLDCIISVNPELEQGKLGRHRRKGRAKGLHT
jgi:hypothetical protein